MSLRSLASALAETLADGGWRSRARAEQLPPPGAWNGWGVLGGRGLGKTWVGSNYTNELAQTVSRIALIGATAADVRDTMIEGESGILRTAPSWFTPTYEPSKRRLEWPNGAQASAFSAEEPERLRGPQFSFLWADELCAWQNAQAVWDMAMFALRIGDHPRWLFTTTPKPIKLLRELLAREGKDVTITRGSTFDNAANLAPPFLEAIRKRYEGTRLGRQELNAELLSDTPGALWQLDWLDRDRVESAPLDLKRVVVAIDPAVSNNEGSDETGIIVAGIDADKHGYILEDLSGRYAPHEWAQRAVAAYRRHKADRIIAKKNNGGDMVENTIRMVSQSVSFKAVHASRGKVTRAEPVSALYEQRKVHHVSGLTALEDQMCSFTSDFNRAQAGYSPDRVDALVWALTELLGEVDAPQPCFGTYGIDGIRMLYRHPHTGEWVPER